MTSPQKLGETHVSRDSKSSNFTSLSSDVTSLGNLFKAGQRYIPQDLGYAIVEMELLSDYTFDEIINLSKKCKNMNQVLSKLHPSTITETEKCL